MPIFIILHLSMQKAPIHDSILQLFQKPILYPSSNFGVKQTLCRNWLTIILNKVYDIILLMARFGLKDIIFNQMDSEYSSNREENSIPKGRPLEHGQKFAVDSGCNQIDILIIDYFSKFGIEDGLVCQLNDSEPETTQIRKQCAEYWPQLRSIIMTNLSLSDLVLYVDYVCKSVDIIFSQEFCLLILTALLSLKKDKTGAAEDGLIFLRQSQIFSLRKFKQAFELKDSKDKKTRKIKKGEKDQKVINKVGKNLKNEKKKRKKQEGWRTSMQYMRDQGMVKKQFIDFFICLREELKKFVESPEPFLSELKIMIKQLENIANSS